MQKLHILPTNTTPEIYLSPDENLFFLRGSSSPEDVRAIYYPVIEWISIFVTDILEDEYRIFTPENPLRLQIDLKYFNSSSAKFLFDIFIEFNKLVITDFPVLVEWYYEEEDTEMREAGNDIASLVGMEFKFIGKTI